ncbi:MAG: tetratricopeptide repeat protein [Cyanophyceae cyanobacterium]
MIQTIFIVLGAAPFSAGGADCSLLSSAPPVVEPSPDRVMSLLQQGRTQHRLGELEAAIASYSRAIELAPDLPLAYVLRGRARFLLEDYRGAVDDQSRAIELKPNFAEAYGSRGVARYRLGNSQQAIEDLWQAANLFQEQGNQQGYAETIMTIKRLAP